MIANGIITAGHVDYTMLHFLLFSCLYSFCLQVAEVHCEKIGVLNKN